MNYKVKSRKDLTKDIDYEKMTEHNGEGVMQVVLCFLVRK